jgi:hypothetical protein
MGKQGDEVVPTKYYTRGRQAGRPNRNSSKHSSTILLTDNMEHKQNDLLLELKLKFPYQFRPTNCVQQQ